MNQGLSICLSSYKLYLLCRSIITSLLTQIPKLFSDIKNPEPALLPTLNAALAALTATGGKVVCSLSALPTWGPGRLFMRDDNKLHGIETEKKLFQTEHPGWKKTASKMVESGVGVDFFIASPGGVYMDIATIGNFDLLLCMVVQKLISDQVTCRLKQEERRSSILTFMRNGTA